MPVKKYLGGLIKIKRERTEAELGAIDDQFKAFFDMLIEKAEKFSVSQTLLGKREYERRNPPKEAE